jgi:hypothetical protein
VKARRGAISDEPVIFCFWCFLYYTLHKDAAGKEEASILYFELLTTKT